MRGAGAERRGDRGIRGAGSVQAPEITAAPEAAEMVNPRVEAEDAGEILERLGIALAAPEGCEAGLYRHRAA